MPRLPRPSTTLAAEPVRLRAQARYQLPVLLSWRQYGLLMVAICAITGLLLLPSAAVFGPVNTLGQDLRLFGSTATSVLLLMSVNLGLRYTHNRARRWLERRRLWLNVLVRIALSLAVAAAFAFAHTHIEGFWGLNTAWGKLENAIAGSQIFAILLIFIQVAVEALERSQYLASENEHLHQQQLEARFEGLKQQLSPHFLFNSLSTLGGLIDEEPAAARRFVGSMAAVYRYLLRHGEQPAVPLHEELRFLEAYCALLQTRFGAGFALCLDLPEGLGERQLPPLALQLLVENAVKHNVLTRGQPLRITIGFVAPDTLLVRNTLRPRPSPEPGSQLGLSNLASRVRLLHHRELEVAQTAGHFTVYVPLPA